MPVTLQGKESPMVLTEEEKQFIIDWYDVMSVQELADIIECKIQFLRPRLYKMGLYKMILEFWTKEQIRFLKSNYKKIGDKELAIIFNSMWTKKKTWTFKHIEKKRKYLKLKRSQKQIDAITARNVKCGAFRNTTTWLTRGVAKIGEKRIWKTRSGYLFQVIKTKSGFVHYLPWLWEKYRGPIPEGFVVRAKNENQNVKSIKDVMLVTHAENSGLNSQVSSVGLSDNYIAGIITHGRPDLRKKVLQDKQLINVKRTQLLLQRKIKEVQAS